MKNKIIQLFKERKIKEVNYSKLLEEFLSPFIDEFSDEEYLEEIYFFAMNAWNFGTMKLILPPDNVSSEINALKDKEINSELLIRMIDFKISDFFEYTDFIADFDITDTEDGKCLNVTTQDAENFVSSMLEKMNDNNNEDDFEENFIDRSAICVKPLQPYIDWGAKLYPEDISGLSDSKTYLISEDIDDVEAWLKKKYNKIFDFELEAWHMNKKEWPQNRSFKLFKEWFHIEISSSVYDFEKKPISKSV